MHIGIGAAIVIVAVIYFMIVSPGFRVFALGVFGLGVLAVIVLIASNQPPQTATSTYVAPPVAPPVAQIPVSNLSIRDTKLSKGSFGAEWILSGVVVNNHEKHTLESVRFKVTMKDCPMAAECLIIGEDWGRSSVTVPPRQARAFEAKVHFQNLPPATKPTWGYEPVGTSAK